MRNHRPFWSKKCNLIILLLGLPLVMFSQQRTITGTITEASSGEPLFGVNVLVKDAGTGTTTDFDGKYSLDIKDDTKVIIFSYVGFTAQEITLGASNVIDVALASGELLDEILVIGYGTVKREDATGAIQSVGTKDFNKGAITGPQELLSGKIPGVVITTGGSPGGGSKIRIRGESSLLASNDPLIIIDGVPIDNDGISGTRNILNIINPNDIESMTVLKDASASAIYGNRASGGVIIITTKKGKIGGETKINYDGNVSLGFVTKKADALNADEYRKIISEQFEEGHSAHDLLGDANTDWQDEIYQTAIGHNHNLGATGAIASIPYRASLGYTNKDGLLKTDNFNRLTASLNLSPGFLDNHLQVKIHAKAMRVQNHFGNTSAIGEATRFDPTQTVLDPDSAYEGFTTWTNMLTGFPNSLAPTNPVALLELVENNSTVNRYITSGSVDYRFPFLPALRANLNLARDLYKSSGTVFIPTTASFAFKSLSGGGVNNKYSQKKTNSLLEFYLNYKKEINKHSLEIMSGYSWQHFEDESEYKNTDIAGTPAETRESNTAQELYLVSLFGRLSYNFDSKYLFTFTLRRDGTSRFAAENRWGLFPSAAVGVKLVDNNNNYFNRLKLRVGLGTTGQEIIPNYYAYWALYKYSFNTASYPFGDNYITTIRAGGYDENIHWEETTTANIALDFSIIKNRLSGSIDFYQKKTRELLNEIPPPTGSNLTNFIFTNIGDMKSKGVEVSLNTTPYLTEKSAWDFAINLAYNNTEITKLLASDDPSYQGVLTGGISGGVGSQIQIHSVGFAPKSFYVFEQLYDDDGSIIEGEFADRNGDGIVNSDDKYRFQKPSGDYTIGLTSNLRLSNFTFSFAGRASLGNYIYNNIQTSQGHYSRLYGTTDVLQNINQSAINNNVQEESNLTYSDHFIQKASFFKIDHVTLAYNFDKILHGAKIYATVQNPLVYSQYEGLDPETSEGIDNNQYPRARTFIFGISVNFSHLKKK